jgi:hypothetical protein
MVFILQTKGEIMIDKVTQKWEAAKLEYEKAIEQFIYYSSLRRQDMAFVTTVQAAILSITGNKLLNLDLVSVLLSAIAFFVLLLGINNERRLAAYMAGYIRRANQIEKEYDMSLLKIGKQEINNRRFLISNTIVFPLYYIILIITWIIVWVLNVVI